MTTTPHPRMLIVGTVPYNTKSTSRAFDSYFHFWERESIAQIFSNPRTPVKGQCGTLYQITDYRLLQRWKGGKTDPGKIYIYDELPDSNESAAIADESKTAGGMYRFGSRHSAFTHLLRGLLWRRKFWRTPQLLEWLDGFSPECVFLSFSDDYFIPRIALFVARRYNIPIVSSIGDDYYYNLRFSLNPLYWLYKLTYRRLIRRVFAWRGSANYISDKIRDKYNSGFGLDGQTVYLSSTVERKPFAPVNTGAPLITYFGNIRMGRNRSLNDIGNALGCINPSYVLEVYSGERDPRYYGIFDGNPNIRFGGSVPYEEVQRKMACSDVTVIVEGFEPKDIDRSRYSLSTKAADALASGSAILAYGSAECGIIDYMKSTHAAFVCSDRSLLGQTIRDMLSSPGLQEEYYRNQIVMTQEHHNLRKSCEVFEGIVQRALSKQE